MQDSFEQTTRKMQEEIKKLKEILVQKDKKLNQKDKELDIERHLWKNREADWDPENSTDLHRIEVFARVISDKSSLHPATLYGRKKFQHVLERAGAYATASGDMPLFRDDKSGMSDPGNRCKLRLRHALLMSLIHKKDNPTQGTLQAIFGVDQTSVCRYPKVMDRILAAVLPTARNISKEVASCKTKEEFKRIVPGDDGGDVIADGTHCPVRHPSEKTLRRMMYTGAKKRFTYNTAVYTNTDGIIIGMSRSSVGATGDITLLREDPMPFGKWAESMKGASTPYEGRIRPLGRQGLPGNRQGSAGMQTS